MAGHNRCRRPITLSSEFYRHQTSSRFCHRGRGRKPLFELRHDFALLRKSLFPFESGFPWAVEPAAIISIHIFCQTQLPSSLFGNV
jgi:hypothetical protein